MDQFDADAIRDWLLSELKMIKDYRLWIEEHEEGGTLRMRLYQCHIISEYINYKLHKLQADE